MICNYLRFVFYGVNKIETGTTPETMQQTHLSFNPLHVIMHSIDEFICKLNNNSCIYITDCRGPFPDLSRFTYTLFIVIDGCEFDPGCPAFPDWFLNVNIVRTRFKEWPRMPQSVRRVVVSDTLMCTLPEIDKLSNLTEFVCYHNPNMAKLPRLPESLTDLNCPYNRLKSIPALPRSIYRVVCNNNNIDDLPFIPAELLYLNCTKNPMTKMHLMPLIEHVNYYQPLGRVSSYWDDLDWIRNIQRFRAFYYSLKFIRPWVWRIREKRMREELHPNRIALLLQDIEPEFLEQRLDAFYEQLPSYS